MTDSRRAQLKQIPAVGDVLQSDGLSQLVDVWGREVVADWVRAAINGLREQIVTTGDDEDQGSRVATRNDATDLVIARVLETARSADARRLGPVINATGVVLHTGLGRAALSNAARQAIVEAAGAANVEVDLETGERRYRGFQLQAAFQQLTGCEDVLVVNNNAAATLLTLQVLCDGKEVVISRGQLIEIGGSFRLPEIFELSGARLREVGTTNRTRIGDYEQAITADAAALMRVHPSNYHIAGFAESAGIEEIAAVARKHGLLAIDDVGSGCPVEPAGVGLPAEPDFRTSLAAGADLVLGSGDKLFGGPQAGVILGRADLIARLRQHPLARALRVGKLTLAALNATLQAWSAGRAESDVPVVCMLKTTVEVLRTRAEKIRDALANVNGLHLDVIESAAQPGGGTMPDVSLPSVALKVSASRLSADSLARQLRTGAPRVFPRIHHDAVLLDLRSVRADEDVLVVQAIRMIAVRFP